MSESELAKPAPAAIAGSNLALELRNVCLSFDSRKDVLRNINAKFETGVVTAILGPSGAGKSSLLDVLLARTVASSGQILLNGKAVTPVDIRQNASYVQQEDILMATQTVRECFTFYARMLLPASLPDKKKLIRVEEIITQLHLERCADNLIGNGATIRGISGGERRRVSVGVSLINRPSILVLDEPTSGLDVSTAVSLLTTLKEIAASGVAVVSTIHQPNSEITAMFDHVFLIARGATVYSGLSCNIESFLKFADCKTPGNTNPADHWLKIMSPYDGRTEQDIEDLISSWKKYDPETHDPSIQDEENSKPIVTKDAEGLEMANFESQSPKAASSPSLAPRGSSLSLHEIQTTETDRLGFFSQYLLLLVRALKDTKRDPLAAKVLIGQYFSSNMLMGLLFLNLGNGQSAVQSRLGLLIFSVLGSAFGTSIGVCSRFPAERGLYMRDRRAGVFSPAAYYLARCTSEIPVIILQTIISSVLIYFMTNMRLESSSYYGTYFGICILIFGCANALGYAVAAAAPNVAAASALAPLFCVLYVLFSGAFILFGDMPAWLSWISWISFCRYGYEAYAVNQFRDNFSIGCLPSERLGGLNGPCPIPDGNALLRTRGMEDADLSRNIGMLAVLIVAHHLLAYIVMRRRDKKARID